MTTATRDWFTEPDGSLTLELSVQVNGEKYVARQRMSDDRYRMAGIPYQYVERELRRKLMQGVEDRLLGPVR